MSEPTQVYDPTDEIVKTVVDAYYSRGVAAADRARERAEKGYTIASAIATALVAAGVFTDLAKRPDVVQVLGLLALGAWLVAALLYIYAVAVPTPIDPGNGWTTTGEFVKGVADDVRHELRRLKRRLIAAVAVTVVAIGLTAATLVTATVDTGSTPPEKARIELTAKGDKALQDLCTRPIGDLYGVVDPDDLDDDVVTVKAPAGACNVDATVLRLPNALVAAERKIIRFPKFP